MGSLVRNRKSGVLLTAVAIVVLAGLLLPPRLATANVDEQKVRLLERLGLDGSDPMVIRAAHEAQTLYGVEDLPGDSGVKVVVRLSGLPDYRSAIFNEDRRLVVDLQNTVDISRQPRFSGSEGGPVRGLRTSQYQVNPGLVARVVVELDETAVPEIISDGDNLVISVSGARQAEDLKPQTETPAAADEIVRVPPVEVNAQTPNIDYMLAYVNASRSASGYSFAVDETYQYPGAAQVSPSATAPTPEASVIETPQEQSALEAAVEPVVAPAMTEAAPVATEEQAAPAAVEAAEQPEQVSASEPAKPAECKSHVALAMAAQPVSEEAAAADPVKTTVHVQLAQAAVELAEEAVQPAAAAPAATAPAAPESATPELGVAAEGEAPQGIVTKDKLVTLIFRDADLSAVLDILARQGDLNILAGSDVRGTVTVRLVDVPLETALNEILNVNGYGFVKTNNIIRILPLSQLGGEVQTVTETFVLSYADAVKVKTMLQKFLSPNGSVEVDQRTNMIIVTDIPANMERIRLLIPQIDKRVRQVLIEVVILDSVLSDNLDLGIQWTALNIESPVTDDDTDSVDVNLPFQATGGLTLSIGSLIGDMRLNTVIQAILDKGNSKVLANPKVLTLNNETASIEIITEFPYNDVTQTSQGGQLSNITFKEVGTKLEVKPQITHDGHVILQVKPEQNAVVDVSLTGGPIVATRRAETTLIVKDKETLVLGGLRLNSSVVSHTKVPFFGDLPGIGYAFRSISTDKEDSELLVFLTVHIVEWPPLLSSEKAKFSELGTMPRKPE
ncbi:MAG: secretin and TonB N-terminal domain-containing protein, partial [Candidatus Lindowbacteria bacterium]|nr:secretin and TonB N-terminal domain-containing protein [Candidatus Lindowbacteria bacterium]